MEFLRTLLAPAPAGAPEVLSRRPFRGREDGVEVMCSFCWCRSNRSRRAKQRAQSGHSKGFSLVWERSWRFRCSNRANERPQVVQTCGLGLSVLGGGMLPLAAAGWPLTSAFLFSFDGATGRSSEFQELRVMVGRRLTRHISRNLVNASEVCDLGAVIGMLSDHST
jgi:hypothetical protein